MIRARQRRSIILAPLLAGLIFFGMLISWFFGVGTPNAQNLPRPFQSKVWKASDGFQTKARCSMVGDLRNRIGLVGRSRTDIVALLGAGDTREIYPHEKSSSSQPTTYVLCEDFPDYIVMTIEWQNGRVSRTYVSQT